MWQELTMNKLFSLKHGFAFDGKFFAPMGKFILLTPGNFHDEGGFKLKTKEKYFAGDFDEQYLLRKGSLIVAMTEQAEGLLGSSAIIPENGKFLHNQRLGLVTDHRRDLIDLRFLYYLFNSRSVRTQIRACATGVKVRHTSPTRIGEVKVIIPNVITQQKIASILSAYDDLIENNTRRIAILEEMAQAIYREWFVNFRFPGHENVKLVDSPLGKIPEGWEVLPVSEVFETLGGGTPSKKVDEYWDGGEIAWFAPSDLTKSGNMYSESSGACITEAGLKKSSAKLFPAYSVMLTSRATIGVLSINTIPACTNQGFITCIPNERVSALQLFFWLREQTEKILNFATGATFKEITKGNFRKFPFLLPPSDITDEFNRSVAPIGRTIELLIQKQKNLRATRDLLLPKLISGKLDVEDLDIDTGELTEQLEEVGA